MHIVVCSPAWVWCFVFGNIFVLYVCVRSVLAWRLCHGVSCSWRKPSSPPILHPLIHNALVQRVRRTRGRIYTASSHRSLSPLRCSPFTTSPIRYIHFTNLNVYCLKTAHTGYDTHSSKKVVWWMLSDINVMLWWQLWWHWCTNVMPLLLVALQNVGTSSCNFLVKCNKNCKLQHEKEKKVGDDTY